MINKLFFTQKVKMGKKNEPLIKQLFHKKVIKDFNLKCINSSENFVVHLSGQHNDVNTSDLSSRNKSVIEMIEGIEKVNNEST